MQFCSTYLLKAYFANIEQKRIKIMGENEEILVIILEGVKISGKSMMSDTSEQQLFSNLFFCKSYQQGTFTSY